MFHEDLNELHRLEWPTSTPSSSVTPPRLQYKPIHPQNLNDRFFVTAAPPKRWPASSNASSTSGAAAGGPQQPAADAAAAARPATAPGAAPASAASAQSGGRGRYVPPHLRNAAPSSALAACIPGLAPSAPSAPSANANVPSYASAAVSSSPSPQQQQGEQQARGGKKGGRNKAPAAEVPISASAGGAVTMHADFQLPSHLRPGGSAAGLSVQLLGGDQQPDEQSEEKGQKKRYIKSKVHYFRVNLL